MKTRTSSAVTLAAIGAVVLFLVVTLVVYRMRPTPGTAFLVLGWMAILATGFFLVRSVASLGEGASLEELDSGRRAELMREKKHLLKAIKEVEFDRDTGKLDDGEAVAAIERYRATAREIMRQLDEDPARVHEAAIEKELVRRLAEPAREPAVAGPPRCATCQAENDEDAAFCKKCGAKLEVRA